MTVVYYVPDIKLPHQSPLVRDNGPLIIGNENPRHDSALGHLDFNDSHGSWDLDAPGSISPFSCLGLSPSLTSSPPSPDNDGYYIVSPVGPYSPSYSDTQSQRARYSSSPFNEYTGYGTHMTPWASVTPEIVGHNRELSPPHRARNGPLLQHQQVLSRPNARQHNDYASGHHNVVDVERIRQGLDVRTTVRYAEPSHSPGLQY